MITIKQLQERGWWPQQRAVELGRGIVLAALVGVVAGLGALAFLLLGEAVSHYTLGIAAGYDGGAPIGEYEAFESSGTTVVLVMVVVVVVGGGVLNSLSVNFLAPEAAGDGTDAAIDAFHYKGGFIRARVPYVKMIASAVTLGMGGSGGREGPISQIGAGFGSFLATRLKRPDNERRVLMSAGVGAGIGAIFQAPLAGAIFATEVLYRDPDFEAENLIPTFISSTVAYCAYNLGLSVLFGHEPFHPLFATAPGMQFNNPLLLLPLTVLAMAMAATAYIHTKCYDTISAAFARLKAPILVKGFVGSLATGLIGVGAYLLMGSLGYSNPRDALGVLSFGYGYLQEIIRPSGSTTLAVSLLLTVGFGKMLTTALTLGSGGSGGVFGPSMVIGGSLGAVVGLVFQRLMPGMGIRVDMFVILGMASFFASAANTPVSTLIMVTEMTASYTLLLPTMWVCALGYVLGGGYSIYHGQVGTRLDSPAHRGDFIVDVLQDMKIRDAMGRATKKFVTVPLAMPLSDIIRMVADTYQSCFPVLDAEGRLYGLFTLNDVRQFLYETGGVGDLAVAQDLAQTVEPLHLEMDLSSAIGRFAEGRFDELPVVEGVEAEGSGRVIGLLRRQDIIAAYSRELMNHRKENKADLQDHLTGAKRLPD